MRRVEEHQIERPGDYFFLFDDFDDIEPRALVAGVPVHPEKGARARCHWVKWTIAPRVSHCGASWEFNGDIDCPTLTPSMDAVGIWHGYITDGHLVEA